MMVDDTLWVAGGPRGVVERDRFPLVLRRHFPKARIARRQKSLIVQLTELLAARSLSIGDVDHGRLLIEPRQRLFDSRGKFGVGDQYLRLTVAQDEGDCLGIETDVQRVQYRSRHR